MKKIILASLALCVISAAAQVQPSAPKHFEEKLNKKETLQLEQEQALKQKINKNVKLKTAGGIVSQRMSHADIAFDVNSGTLSPFYSPLAPDSTFLQDFGTGADGINVHGFGQTFDPTSVGFPLLGLDYFDTADSYTIDTIYIGGRYRLASPTTGLTGDTLEVTYFMGDNANDNVWRVGIGYAANTFPGQANRLNVLPPRFTGNANIGTPGIIDAPNKITLKIPLKALDTASTFIKVVPSSPIQVPAGEKFGVFCSFIPGYSYDPSTQLYYISGSKSDVNYFARLYYRGSNASDDTPYFLEKHQIDPDSEGIGSALYSNTRYAAWTGTDAFRNEYASPSTTRGNIIDFWVSGNSTVGLKEQSNKTMAKLYPTQSNGVINLQFKQGGTYNLQIVNLLGQTLHQENVELNGNEKLTRDVSHLKSGVYLFILEGDGNRQTIKFSIQ